MAKQSPVDRLAIWRRDPVSFIEEVLIDGETNKPFVLYAEEKEFLRRGFELTAADGRMRFTELCYSAGKKSGKTGLAGMVCIFTAVVLAGQGGEINCLANDLEQSQSRVFKAVVNILQASPLLRDSVDITANRIVFRSTGTIVSALANDYEGFSGGNPTLNVYDELAYYTSESARRLWTRASRRRRARFPFVCRFRPPASRANRSPLRDLYDRALDKATEVAPDLYVHENMLLFWTHRSLAPWHSQQWVSEMQRTYARRPSQFKRLILNHWVSAEGAAIDLDEWDRCTDPELRPLLGKSEMLVWVALDLGLRHDSTALVAVGWEGDRVRLVTHEVFTARSGETLDVEATAEAALLSLRSRFALQECRYDPWQAIGLAQRLQRAGVKMTEYPQTLPNLSMITSNLIDLLRTSTLLLYPSDELRQAASKTIMIESARGMRLGKAKQSDRVDPIIALAMAVLGATQGRTVVLSDQERQWQAHAQEVLAARAPGRSPQSSSRLYANGQQICDEEDALSMRGIRGLRSRWSRGAPY